MNNSATAGELTPKMSAWQKSVFGMGSAAFGIKDMGFNLLLLLFYQQIVGVSGTLVGFAIMIALICDAFFDPIIGAISDNWRSRWGRRHPFMFASAIPVAVLYFMLWNPPDWSQSALFVYLLVIAVLVRVAIACYEIPSLALVAELSPDYDERTTILAYRLFFQTIIPAVVGIITFTVFLRSDGGAGGGAIVRDGFTGYALFAAAAMFLSIVLSSYGTRSRIQYLKTNLERERASLRDVFRQVWDVLANPSFLMVTIASFFSAISSGIGTNLSTYFGLYFWRFTGPQLSVLVFASMLAAAVSLPLSPWLSRRFGKKITGIVLVFGFLILSNGLILVKMAGWLPPDGSNALLLVFFLNTLASTVCLISCVILLWSMITDVNEDNQVRTGQRSEGVIAASNSFINKAVSGIGVLIAGVLVDLVHLPPKANPATLDPHIIQNLLLLYMPVSIILTTIAMIFLALYRIDRTAHENNLLTLGQAAVAESRADGLIDTPKLG